MTSPDRADALMGEIAELYAIVLRIARRVHQDDDAMTATQRLALMEVAAAGPLRLRQLAGRMDTTPATATRAVDALEELGLVVRKPDPNDRRGVLVDSTARGRRWADVRRDALRQVVDTVAPHAPGRLASDLARLNAALRAETGHDDVSRHALLTR
jgi:DNA-binding MarR family transcriptional regulator